MDSVGVSGEGGQGTMCSVVRLKAAHLLNNYPYVLVQYNALSEYSFPFAD